MEHFHVLLRTESVTRTFFHVVGIKKILKDIGIFLLNIILKSYNRISTWMVIKSLNGDKIPVSYTALCMDLFVYTTNPSS